MADNENQITINSLKGYWNGANGQVFVETPEQLAAAGITVHPNAVERTWGKDGVVIYQAAVRETGRQTISAGPAREISSIDIQMASVRAELARLIAINNMQESNQ